ncbi:uncharacterized protein LOC134204202 isoform X1 [Armigeres subalbatus]|uniref:uncharacterized protein LOC134204202 isoform X1 n=1 Tax=Armigeres subalbatus TaxID=124917 RepID=UPI002ED3E018
MAKNQWPYVHVLTVVLVVASVSLTRASDATDFRVFDFGDEDTEFFSSSAYEKAFNDHSSYFPTDLNLGALDLISATPNFAKFPSHIDPSDVEVARAKRKTVTSSEEQTSEEEDGDEKSDSSEGADGYVDRYERFVSHNFKDRDEPKQKDEVKGDGANYSYRFDYSPSDDYERIKQESESQSRQLAKDPKNCKSFKQDGMLCHVCRDPATDTTSESCAYATVPHHKKFAFVKQKNYNSKDHEKDDDEEGEHDEGAREDDTEDEDDDGDQIEKTTKPSTPAKQQTQTGKISNLPQKRKVIPTKKSVVHHKPGQDAINGGGYRYQPVDMRSNKQRSQSDATAAIHPAYYDFYTQFFPAMHGEGSGRSQKMQRQQEVPANNEDVYVLNYQNQDQVAKVLADFESRDWSNCKKGNKNELTCYTCTDKNGVKHEECMYLSESRQVSAQVKPPPPPPAADSTPPTAEPKKTSRRKKVQTDSSAEKKPISPKLKRVNPKTTGENKSAKLQLEEDVNVQGDELSKGLERQTVKRTVSIKSHVDGDGLDPLDGERVVHYEHHVSHRL